MPRRACLIVVLAALFATGSLPALAQPATRVVTNVPALLAFPLFYHLRSVMVRGELTTSNDRTTLSAQSGERGIEVVIRSGSRPRGLVEVRGVYWDIGRMTTDDPRFAGFEIHTFLDGRTGGAWPRPGELPIIVASDRAPAPPLPAPSVRTIALDPWRYEGEKVTVVGEFRGNNLYGDEPKEPTAGKWDFVLRSANAAIWVTGLRPKGKGFDLDPHAKVDTGKILEVTGLVKTAGGLSWIVASAIEAPASTAGLPRDEAPDAEAPLPPPPPMPPPQVIFSLPTEGETDVSASAPIRIQLSRNLDPATLQGRIQLNYLGAAPPNPSAPPAIPFSFVYGAADRVIEIRLTKPLAPYRTVRVELLEGVKGTDGQALKPWGLTFTTGSQ
jgi:hypothetical protein